MPFSEFLDGYQAGGRESGGGGRDLPPLLTMYLAEENIPKPLLDDVPFFDFASFLDVNDPDVSRKIWLLHNSNIAGGEGNGKGGGRPGGENDEGDSKTSRDSSTSADDPVAAHVGAREKEVGGGGSGSGSGRGAGWGAGWGGKRRRTPSPSPGRTRKAPQPQSLPHTDNFENILVQLEGVKELVIVPPTHGLFVYAGGWSEEAGRQLAPHYSPVDFHDPDRRRHPKFFRCEAISVQLEAGDALYLPAYWWHHVRAGSAGRNLAVNFWYPTVSAMLRTAMDGMEEGEF
jgi:hypothetical protein